MNSIFLFVFLVFLFGSGPYSISLQLGTVAPEPLVAYRFALAAVFLMGVALMLGRSLRFSLREHRYLALQGVLMFSFTDLLFYYAVARIPSGLAQLVMSMLIIGNVLFGALFLALPVRPRVVLGAIIGLGGIALVSWPELQGIDLTGTAPLGLAIAIAAMLSVSLGITTPARNQRAGLPVLETTGICMGYGAAVSFIVSLLLGRGFAFEFSPTFLGAFAWVTVMVTAAAFLIWLVLLGRLGHDRAAYVILLTPIVALTISTVLEDYVWTGLAVAGIALVLAGNVIVLSKVEKAPLAAVGNSGNGA